LVSAAQSQLHDAFWLRLEQHPHHHHLHVFELDGIGFVQAHGALHPLGTQVQVADAAVFGGGGRRVARVAEGGMAGGGKVGRHGVSVAAD
jgi:hypothetical protein